MIKWTFYIETYGCKVNQYESQAVREAWRKLGGVECFNPAVAEFVLINSCAITGKAERDARNAVFRLKRQAPEAKIILCGCAAQFFQSFKPRGNANWAAPDACLEQRQKNILLRGPWIDGAEQGRAEKLEVFSGEISLSRYNRARPVVKMQDGCSQNCSYCIVPQTRGNPVSRSPVAILDECRALLESGHCELMLSGVNLRQYGRDRPDYGDFWSLLAFLERELAPEYGGRARLRLSSLEPSQLTERGLEILAGCGIVCPHLHLSLQHASQAVLKRMGRGHYTAGQVQKAVMAMSSHWRPMGLGADILVGFPGETENDMAILEDFIDSMPFTYAHVFPYSARQGTAARKFASQLTRKIKHERAERIRERIRIKKNIFLKSQLGACKVRVAADLPPAADDSNLHRGVSETYAVCFFNAEHGNQPGYSLFDARPVGISGEGLLVEPAGAKR